MVPARRRRALHVPLPLLSLLSAARPAPTAAAGPKTILSVLVDDLGHADTQVGGRNMVSPTPVLGELAKEGIVLESHCALPIPHPPGKKPKTDAAPKPSPSHYPHPHP